MTWVKIAPELPPEIAGTAGLITQGITELRNALEVVKVEAQAAAALVSSRENQGTALANSAINAVIQNINTILAAALDNTGVYVLAIPLPKQGLARLIPDAIDEEFPPENTATYPLSRGASNLLTYPITSMASVGSTVDEGALRDSTLIRQILNPINLLIGGNAHYLNTVAAALFDANDPNKPKLTDQSYWAYAAMLAGASDLTRVLAYAGWFGRLIGVGQNANELTPSRGLENLVPREVEVVPSGRGGFPVIQWQPVPSSSVLRSFDHSTVIARRFAIIRSTGIQALTAQRVTDLFSTRQLVRGLRGNFGAEVIAVQDYDGVINRWVDTTTLTAGGTYYYHLAFATQILPAILPAPENQSYLLSNSPEFTPPRQDRTDVVGEQARAQYLNFDLLSSGAEFNVPQTRADYGRNRMGTAPDWVRSPAITSITPAIERLVGLVQEYVRSFQNATRNATSQLERYVAFLNGEIARYSAKIDDLNRINAQLLSIFESPGAGIYGTIRSGQGSETSVIASLTKALEEDPSLGAPDFNKGDEFVTGIFILGAESSSENINRIYNLLQAFFAPSSTPDPALEGIESINAVLAQIETALVTEITGGGGDPTSSPVTFNSDMTPRPVGSGDSSCD